MKSLLSKLGRELSDHGIKVLIKRILFYIYAWIFYLLFLKSKVSVSNWKTLCNSFKGETIFILGNGPSLLKTPLYLLKDKDTFGFNHIDLMASRNGWFPKWFMITDNLVMLDKQSNIDSCISNSEGSFFPIIHPSGVNFFKFIGINEKVHYMNTLVTGFHRNLPHCGINDTVVSAAIQVSIFLGYSKIVFIGMDLNYKNMEVKKNNRDWVSMEKDINHFDSRYFGKGRRFHDPNTNRMLQSLNTAKIFFPEIKFVNCTLGGNLECFERSTLKKELGLSDSDEFQIFCDSAEFEGIGEIVKSFLSEDSASFLELNDESFLIKSPKLEEIRSYGERGYKVIGPYREIYFLTKP